ncbi:Hypothetical predicted protein, partial [Pelobates cultripes]
AIERFWAQLWNKTLRQTPKSPAAASLQPDLPHITTKPKLTKKSFVAKPMMEKQRQKWRQVPHHQRPSPAKHRYPLAPQLTRDYPHMHRSFPRMALKQRTLRKPSN